MIVVHRSRRFICSLVMVGICWMWGFPASGQEASEAYKSLQRGRIYLARRNIDAAIEAFKKAIELQADYPEAHYYLGLAYTRKGLWAEALPLFRQAIELREGGIYPEAYLGLAGCTYFQGDFASAIEYVQKAISQRGEDKPFAAAYNLLGLAYYRSDLYEPAVEAFRRASQQRSRYPDALCSLGDALWLQATTQPGRGEPGVTLDRAWKESNMREAIAAYRQAIEQQSNFARAHRQLGLALIGIDPEEARRELELFLQYAPHSSDAAWVQQVIKDLRKISDLHRCDEADLTPVTLQSQPSLESLTTEETRRVKGVIELGAIFTADGKVKAVHVIKGLRSDLDAQAIKAVRNLKFQPAKKDGKPVSVLNTVRITY
ncbi:MAG: TonB family protein [Acidobacteria bacterium]|nr:MAG: TonB family protein [Acidobacteriota bacterium]